MREIIREKLTYFQRRRLMVIASKMNIRMRELIPELKEDVFKLHEDKQAYGIMLSTDTRIDDQIKNQVMSEFSREIANAVAFKNPFRKIAAEATSLIIWETPGAFQVMNESPYFKLTSGAISPMYIDGASEFTWPAFMNLISSFVQIELQMVLDEVDVVVGGEARGIPGASWVAKDLAKGTGIARKVIKEHGTGNSVEGGILPGDKIVLFEDLITNGASKEPFITNIRNAGAKVIAVVVVFDRKQGGEEFLREKFGVRLISITDIDIHLKVGLEYGYITLEEEQSIRNYLKDPRKWNNDRVSGKIS